jgi:hypothetical protein
MLQERPGIRVLYMSGYVEKSLLVAKHPESILLQKPFTPQTLQVPMPSHTSPSPKCAW